MQLNYLCLNKIKACALRVQQRVSEGGHHVDARTIKGVYEMNLKYINEFYLHTFNMVQLFDGTQRPTLLVTIEAGEIIWAHPTSLKKEWIKIGLPVIANKIADYFKYNNS